MSKKNGERKILWTTTRSKLLQIHEVSPGNECREHVKGS